MAVLDTVWIFMVFALLLAFLVLIGYIILKMGLDTFKMIMSTVYATRNIEKMKIVQKDSKYRIAEKEDDELKIIGRFIKSEIDKNRYTSYLYKKFKVKILIANTGLLIGSLDTKMDIFIEKGSIFIGNAIRKNQYTNYINKQFKQDIISQINSFKDSIKSKIKKHNYTKYAYIQLFKK